MHRPISADPHIIGNLIIGDNVIAEKTKWGEEATILTSNSKRIIIKVIKILVSISNKKNHNPNYPSLHLFATNNFDEFFLRDLNKNEGIL